MSQKTRVSRRLTAQEVCSIIKACGDTGAVELKFEDLHISFQAGKEVESVPTHHSTPGPGEETRHMIRDEAILKEIELANMALENPTGYEDLLAGEDLVTDKGEYHAEIDSE